jgi:glycosyltransferase involved in cell wall biosynthesis
VARKALTFVNSRKMFLELEAFVPNLAETRTTTLTRADFFEREDTCIRAPYRLLYTGRMTRGKGLVEMVEALALLVHAGEDVVLDLVGWPEKGDDVLEELKQIAGRLKMTERVTFYGPKAAGPELYAYYRESDIYVIASKTSEGFPRTIWEAMAHSLPVVATTVGSIPNFVGEAAALVTPNNTGALVEAIWGIIHSAEKRQEMIRSGRTLASEMTLEIQVAQMIREMEKWIQRRTGASFTSRRATI